jgi:hypothetical protein
MKRLLNDASEVDRLAKILDRCPGVRKFDTSETASGTSIVFCFQSLEEHFHELLDVQLPRLLEETIGDAEREDLLYEIGATLGQIAWHIRLPAFYRYLGEPHDV